MIVRGFGGGFAICAAALMLAACGSSSNTASPSSTGASAVASTTTSQAPPSTTIAALAQLTAQFGSDEGAFDAVASQVDEAVSQLGTDPSAGELGNAVAPFVTAAQSYETQVTALGWPAAMTVDANAVERAASQLVGLLQSIGVQDKGFSDAGWEAAGQAASGVESASNRLGHDLGLPPES